MAEQGTQKSTEISIEIKLNEVFVGKRRLRYIYLHQPNIVSTKLEEQKQYMLLFLGCDVLDECSISSGNLPRFHAKHAKRGLAAKMNFQSGVRVVGIHGTTRGVWFYSIQGLFKIAFDYYTRDEQSHCLSKLQEAWQKQIFEPVLKAEIHVVFRNSTEGFDISCNVTSNPATKERNNSTTIEISDIDQFIHQINRVTDSVICENNECLKNEIDLLKIYLSASYMSHKENSDSFLNRTINLVRKCLKLLPTLSEKLENLGSVPLSDSCSCSDDPRYDRLTSSNESQNKNSVDNLNNACKKFSDNQHECNKEAVTREIAQWLGEEFLNYHAEINKRVISFKQRNMSSIGNLPSAKDLVNEVFPLSMQVFLYSWFQLPLAKSECSMEDSDNRSNLFPVIQLILELANQSLVSGVAHVLFSQLVQSDRVQ